MRSIRHYDRLLSSCGREVPKYLSIAHNKKSCSVWPSALYEKTTVTGEKVLHHVDMTRKIPTDCKSEKGLLIIFGGPSLPRESPWKLLTASKLMVNTADHPSYYELNASEANAGQ